MSNHIVKGRNQTANTTNIIYHLNSVKQLITQPPRLSNGKRMWVSGKICIKQYCGNVKNNWKYPQVFLHEGQLDQLLELRNKDGTTIRVVTKEHIGKVVCCVDHYPVHIQQIIYNQMLNGYFDWSQLSEKELTEAKMTIGLRRHDDIRRHSLWKTSKQRWQGKEWRFTEINKKALKQLVEDESSRTNGMSNKSEQDQVKLDIDKLTLEINKYKDEVNLKDSERKNVENIGNDFKGEMNTKVENVNKKIKRQSQEISTLDIVVCQIKKRQTKTQKYMDQFYEDMGKRTQNQEVTSAILNKIWIDISK